MNIIKMTKLALLTANESSAEVVFLYEIHLIGVVDLLEDVKKTIGLDLIKEAGFKKEDIKIYEQLNTPLVSDKHFKLDNLPKSIKNVLQFDGQDKKIWDMIDKKQEDDYLAFGIFNGTVVSVS